MMTTKEWTYTAKSGVQVTSCVEPVKESSRLRVIWSEYRRWIRRALGHGKDA